MEQKNSETKNQISIKRIVVALHVIGISRAYANLRATTTFFSSQGWLLSTGFASCFNFIFKTSNLLGFFWQKIYCTRGPPAGSVISLAAIRPH